jgi:PTH1 family peptidyl-tRNA hydrolase
MAADMLHQQAERSVPYVARFQGLWALFPCAGHDVGLLKPQTFMNRSGQSVAQAMSCLQICDDDLLVLHDDLDLPFGQVKVKVGGGSGGHRGLESCFSEIGTQDFARVRMGIGRPDDGEVTQFVLEQFDANEKEQLSDVVRVAADAAEETIQAGAVAAMNRFNRRIAEGGKL